MLDVMCILGIIFLIIAIGMGTMKNIEEIRQARKGKGTGIVVTLFTLVCCLTTIAFAIIGLMV